MMTYAHNKENFKTHKGQRKRQTELEEWRGRTNGGLSEGHRER